MQIPIVIVYKDPDVQSTNAKQKNDVTDKVIGHENQRQLFESICVFFFRHLRYCAL